MKSLFKYFFGLAWVQYSISFILYLYLQLVYYTSTRQVISDPDFDPEKYATESGIYVFWHNRLALMPFARPSKLKVNVLSSDHRDGRTVAQVMRIFGFNTIFGSSNKNSFYALKALLKRASLGESIAITPDGPKGPKNQINGNVIAISGLSGKYIYPMSYSCARAIIFNSWDRFILPTPFNRLVITYGTPILAPKKLSSEQSQTLNEQLRINLNAISSRADAITGLDNRYN